MLKSFDEQNFLLSAGTPGTDHVTTGDGPKPMEGLIAGHAYSIIQVKEYKGHRLLNIRNPWGQTEWNGAWGDNDAHWTPDIIEALDVKFGDDGDFWMAFEDFITHYSGVNVCKICDWQEIRVKGSFSYSWQHDGANENKFNSMRPKFIYKLNVPEQAATKPFEFTFVIHQEDKRI